MNEMEQKLKYPVATISLTTELPEELKQDPAWLAVLFIPPEALGRSYHEAPEE